MTQLLITLLLVLGLVLDQLLANEVQHPHRRSH
jgi:hypothetical protein